MKSNLECISCFLNQSLEAARMATDDEEVHVRVMRAVMSHLQNASFNNSPPEISREIHDIIRHVAGSEDPYKKVKKLSNDKAEKLYSHLKEMVNEADDPLLTAVKLSIIGNVIDFGTSNRYDVEDMIDKAMDREVGNSYSEFKSKLEKTENILYLADNAGETFFDRLLIAKLADMGKKITYVVKANPIINDATIEDAIYAGIDNFAEIIEGDKGLEKSAPGTILSYTSKDFLNHFKNADTVIAKGQGNYESLSNVDRDMIFLLMVKCPLVANDIGIEVGNLVLKVKE